MARNQLEGFPFHTSQMDISKSKVSIGGQLVDLDTVAGTYAGAATITSGTVDNVSVGATTKATSVNSARFASDAAAGQTQIAYAGVAETISKAMLWLRARISGDVTTADASFPARIAPFKMSVTDAARSTSGVGVAAFHLLHIASGSGTTTGTDHSRESASFRLQVEGRYGATGYLAFTPFQTISYSSSTQGGAGGWTTSSPLEPSQYHRGEMFGGCVTTWVANGATNFMGCTGFEVNWAVHTGGNVGRKVGLALIKDTSDAVAGTVMDAGIEISSKTASVAPIGIGIQFGNPVGFWAFDNTSTLIGSKRRGQDISAVSGPEATVAANYGVDLREVTISTAAFASTGFKVDGLGRVTLTVRGNYADDVAAAAGGVAVGEVYRNGSALMIRVS